MQLGDVAWRTCGPISPYIGRDCVKSLRSTYTGRDCVKSPRSSYTGVYPQTSRQSSSRRASPCALPPRSGEREGERERGRGRERARARARERETYTHTHTHRERERESARSGSSPRRKSPRGTRCARLAEVPGAHAAASSIRSWRAGILPREGDAFISLATFVLCGVNPERSVT